MDDNAYAWIDDPETKGEHKQKVVLISTYIQALEDELGMLKLAVVRQNLGLPHRFNWKEDA